MSHPPNVAEPIPTGQYRGIDSATGLRYKNRGSVGLERIAFVGQCFCSGILRLWGGRRAPHDVPSPGTFSGGSSGAPEHAFVHRPAPFSQEVPLVAHVGRSDGRALSDPADDSRSEGRAPCRGVTDELAEREKGVRAGRIPECDDVAAPHAGGKERGRCGAIRKRLGFVPIRCGA